MSRGHEKSMPEDQRILSKDLWHQAPGALVRPMLAPPRLPPQRTIVGQPRPSRAPPAPKPLPRPAIAPPSPMPGFPGMAAPGGPPLDPRSAAPDSQPAIRFIVPTPAGPVHLTQLLPKPNIQKSLVVLRTSYTPLLPISDLYNAFVSPFGPVGTLGHQVVSTLLEVDRPIDTGRSWEFAVLLLHAHKADLLTAAVAGDDRPVLVWASGIVAFDPAAPLDAQRLAADTLHLADKIDASRDLMDVAAREGCRIVALVPDTAEGAGAAEILTGLLAGHRATVATCATIGAARRALAGNGAPAGAATDPAPAAGKGDQSAPPPDLPTAADAGTGSAATTETDASHHTTAERGPDARQQQHRWWKWAGLGVLAITGIGGFMAFREPLTSLLFPSGAPAEASSSGYPASGIIITGLYLPPGRLCGTLLFQAAPRAHREAARPMADGSGLELPAENLCALEVRGPPGTRLDVDPAIKARFSVAIDGMAPSADWTRLVVRPQAPAGPVTPLDLRFAATGATASTLGPVRLVTTNTPAATGREGLP